ncbi:hypothetical protein M0812_18686 [Anaeramoeba flamelloides]|uniref:Uncharacterized protein n=1 Tax=Anaeramoeba flamelloides TaxID=1746091 RepID=A0AAV7Z653_9EUKA|nr:hypothetical protein M0812_18686 [Anaeramoeba flamelloides]
MTSLSFKSEHKQNQKIKKKIRKIHDRSYSFCQEEAKFWCPESKKKFCQEHNKEFHPTERIEKIHCVEEYTNQNTHKQCICEQHNIQKKFFKDNLICIECLVNNLFHEGKLRKGANKTFFRDSEQSEQYSWETNRIKDRITKQSQIMMKRKELALETKIETEKERKKELKKLEDQHREFDQQINKIFEKFTNENISRYQSKIDLIDKKINTEKGHLKEFNKSREYGERIQEAYDHKSNSENENENDKENEKEKEKENESQNENEKENFKENDDNIESESDSSSDSELRQNSKKKNYFLRKRMIKKKINTNSELSSGLDVTPSSCTQLEDENKDKTVSESESGSSSDRELRQKSKNIKLIIKKKNDTKKN